jgi:DNA-binding response OmpR family regulator
MSLGSDRDRALEAGADGYIVKPFSPRALLAELDTRLP